MVKMIRAIRRIGNALGLVLDSVVFTLTFSSIWLFVYLVFMRYVMSQAHDWGDELVQAVIVSAMILAAAGTTRDDEHTSIDYLPVKLGGRRRVVLLSVGYGISLVVCCIMGWTGLEIVGFLKAENLVSTSSLPIPMWLTGLMLPVALFASAFYFLEKLLQKVHQLRTGKGVFDSL